MTTQRTYQDDEGLNGQKTLNEGKSESRYRLSEKTIRILKENKKIKSTPIDEFFLTGSANRLR